MKHSCLKNIIPETHTPTHVNQFDVLRKKWICKSPLTHPLFFCLGLVSLIFSKMGLFTSQNPEQNVRMYKTLFPYMICVSIASYLFGFATPVT